MCIFCSLLSRDDVPCEAFEKKCKETTKKYIKTKKIKDKEEPCMYGENQEWTGEE
jgi:hypothetical protein